ncbi:hypothetical protein WKV44_06285 [Spirochaetia bacterium 38H-sp]|uniref:Uncharacterized protein n=1 Tax=Rarispira pelagica TaxID=3141764 RepID=A0ABU9UDW8_9SPIR
MAIRNIPEYLEELFSVFRLYGWCDRVHRSLDELSAIKEQKERDVLQQEALKIIRKKDADKHEAFLSLIILKKSGIPVRELYEDAYRALRNRLYLNDFPFVIRYLFDNKIPLPKALVYDITERLFFSIEDIYSRIVEDFKRVPFKSAEDVVFYLLLQNCRVDLNSQNKELICIILLHIEIKIPDYVIVDIVDYMDENATLKDNWKEQKERIVFSREEKKEEKPVYTVDKEKRDVSNLPQEYVIEIDKDTESTELPDRENVEIKHHREYSEPDRYDFSSMRQKEEEDTQEPAERASIDLDSIKKGSAYDNLVRPVMDSSERRDDNTEDNRPQILPDTEKSDAKYEEYTGLDNKKVSKRRKKEDDNSIKSPVIEHREKQQRDFALTEETIIKKTVIEYGDYIDPNKERGIRLDRLDKNKWKKDKKEAKVEQEHKTEKKATSTQKKEMAWIPSSFFKENEKTLLLILSGLLIGFIILWLMLVFSKKNPPVSPVEEKTAITQPAENESPQIQIENKTPEKNSTALEKDIIPMEKDFTISLEDGVVVWRVNKGQSFYDLYEYIKKNKSSLSHDLQSLADSSWQNFIAHLQSLNQQRFPNIQNMDTILPLEKFIILKK